MKKLFSSLLIVGVLGMAVNAMAQDAGIDIDDEVYQADLDSMDLESEDYMSVLDTNQDSEYDEIEKQIQDESGITEKMIAGENEQSPSQEVAETPETQEKVTQTEIAEVGETKEAVVEDEVETVQAAPVRVNDDARVQDEVETQESSEDTIGGSAPLFQN